MTKKHTVECAWCGDKIRTSAKPAPPEIDSKCSKRLNISQRQARTIAGRFLRRGS